MDDGGCNNSNWLLRDVGRAMALAFCMFFAGDSGGIGFSLQCMAFVLESANELVLGAAIALRDLEVWID